MLGRPRISATAPGRLRDCRHFYLASVPPPDPASQAGGAIPKRGQLFIPGHRGRTVGWARPWHFWRSVIEVGPQVARVAPSRHLSQMKPLALLRRQTARRGCLDLVDDGWSGRKNIPQPCRLVVGAGENPLAVGREGDHQDRVCVSLELRDRSAGRRVPQPCRAVRGAGENSFAVRREGDGADRLRVSLERRDRSPGRSVPQPRRFVDGAGENQPAVRREGDGSDKSPCPSSVGPGAPVAASHSRAVFSKEPVSMRLPSGEKATAVTMSLCPSSVATAAPVAASHSRAVLSQEPVRTRLPSGEKATAVTGPVCPSSVASAAPVVASHSLTVFVPRCQRQLLAVRREGDGANRRVALERGGRRARGRVPQPYRLVVRCR